MMANKRPGSAEQSPIEMPLKGNLVAEATNCGFRHTRRSGFGGDRPPLDPQPTVDNPSLPAPHPRPFPTKTTPFHPHLPNPCQTRFAPAAGWIANVSMQVGGNAPVVAS